MRIALILSLLLAILAVVFALQNPGFIDVEIGPWEIRESTALVLMVTFCLGVVVGILATIPTIVKRKRRIRHLERSVADERVETTTSTRETETETAPPPTTKEHRTE